MSSAEETAGPVLTPGRGADAVIAAIRDLDAAVIVVSRGAYLRVLARGACAATRRNIEAHLGGPFLLPGDLEAIMPAFRGRLSITAERVEWIAPSRRG